MKDHDRFYVSEKNPYKKSMFLCKNEFKTRFKILFEMVTVFQFLHFLVKSRNFFNAKFEFLSSNYPQKSGFLLKKQDMQKIKILSFDAKRYRQPAESNLRHLERSILRLTDMPLTREVPSLPKKFLRKNNGNRQIMV